MRYLLFVIFLLIIQQKPSTTCMSAEEVELFRLINTYRKSAGLKEIPASAKLTKVAQAHVRDLEENYTFSRSNRCNPHSWSDNGDWTACCYTNDHAQAQCMWDKPREIAGYASDGYEIAFYASSGATPGESLNGWINSDAHKPVIANLGTWSSVKWEAMGVGIYKRYAVVWFGMERDPSPCDQ